MRPMVETQPVQVSAAPFEDGVVALMGRIQSSLSDLVEALPETIRRAVDLERALRLEKKLAWQVFRLSRSTDVSEAANVPSLVSIARLTDAARKRGVPEKTLARVRKAFEEFENFASIHGGDRQGLISMVSGMGGVASDKNEQYEINVRKALFRGHSHVWGVHARMAVRTGIFMPRSENGMRMEDVVLVVGDVGLVRRRLGDPLVMLWWLWTDESRWVRGDDERKPSAASAAGAGAATLPARPGLEFLPEVSSKPLPQMVSKRGVDGTAETELIFPPGRAGAITMYSMERRQNVSNQEGASFFGQTLFTMPLEAMVWEMLVPVGWSNPATARAGIYGRRHHPEQVYEERTEDLLPQRVSLDYLGVHDGVPPLAGDPNHAGAVRHALERGGWLGTRFDVYRCRVEYPIMYTMLVIRADALKR